MACVVCITPFSKPFSPKPSKEAIPAEASSEGVVLQKATSRIGHKSDLSATLVKFPNPMNCHGLKLATVSGDGAKLPMLTRHISSPATSWLTVKSGVHEVVISGYWMGPDIEDGWGYVEAVVYQTF